MRLRTLAGSVVAVTITFGVGLPAVPAAAADVTTLYVDKTVSCSDSAPGAGSTDLPYCTISAAAKVVLPGQTVFIRGGAYDEHVTINRSGTADHPIIFTGAYPGTHEVRAVIQALTANETVPAITVSGAHDVTIRDLALYGAAGDYLVDSSSRITIDHNEIQQDGYSSAVGVRLTGGTTATSVSRNSFSGYSQSVSVQLDAGTHDNTVTTNQFSIADQGAVLATDAPGTVVTSNTLVAGCGLDISLAGASSGSTVENNVAAAGFNPGTCSGGSTVGLTVSTGSATGTTADYNVFHPLAAGRRTAGPARRTPRRPRSSRPPARASTTARRIRSCSTEATRWRARPSWTRPTPRRPASWTATSTTCLRWTTSSSPTLAPGTDTATGVRPNGRGSAAQN